MSTETDIRPFQIDMPDEAIADLRRRIAATRWPTRELVADRSQGVQLATIQELARYWVADYDWRACEAKLNALPQFTTEVDGVDIHFIHVQSRHENALPLIITHGWPGTVIELLEVVGPLTDPAAHGGQVLLGERTSRSSCGRAGSPGGQAHGRLHHVPRRDLPGPAQLGREVVPQRHLLQRGQPGRSLRRLGRARAVCDRDPGGVQVAALTAARTWA